MLMMLGQNQFGRDRYKTSAEQHKLGDQQWNSPQLNSEVSHTTTGLEIRTTNFHLEGL
jgi:hypothetical protein